MPKHKNSSTKGTTLDSKDKFLTPKEKQDLLSRIKNTEDIDEILEITKCPDPEIRIKAAQQLCPCRVKDDYEPFWDRLFEMVDDEVAAVRRQVFHNICDGSPPRLEWKVKEAMDKLNGDSDSELRRKVHKVMASYLKNGEWNIL